MNKAILLAIKGGLKEGEGWKFMRANSYWAIWLNGNGDETNIAIEKYLLSPEFWQALGKACGWPQDDSHDVIFEVWKKERWLGRWHAFIDHLAEGKSPDSFFESLLADK
jgi:hypothetical protein